MRATPRPEVANRIGYRPQARPSLRLLTSPAWLAADRAFSRKLVRVKICRPVSPSWWSPSRGTWVRGLVPGVVAGLADEHGGQSEAEGGEGDAEQERRGAQPVLGGQPAGGQGGGGDGEVAGGLVEAHGQAAAGRADEVDLHDDGGGPGQALVDAEQDVGGDDPAPGRRPDQQQRHGQADQPAGDQDGFAAVPVGQGAGGEVGQGLGDAERDDEGQRRR